MRQTVPVRLLNELRDIVRHRGDRLTCQQAVELVTEYLEGAMTPPTRACFERHLRTCPHCVAYVEQVRRTADVLGHVQPVPPTGATRDALLDAFRDFDRD